MKSKIKYIIFTVIISSTIFISNVFAEVKIEPRKTIYIDGKTVSQKYDNLADGTTDNIRDTGMMQLNIDGITYDGYCIEFGVNLTAGAIADTHDLYSYYEPVLGETESKALVQKLMLYAKIGYGIEGREDPKYYLATQQLIWQTINDTGFYQTEYYENRAGKKINIKNFRWILEQENEINIDAEINEVETAANNYYIKPSFCSEQKQLEIEVGTTEVYTDTNDVLQLYQVICDDGLECKKEGNNLIVTSIEEDMRTKTITFKKASSGEGNILYRPGTEQSLIINNGLLETMICDFKINSFQNVQTSDTKIVYISIISLLCCIVSYIIYKTKQS